MKISTARFGHFTVGIICFMIGWGSLFAQVSEGQQNPLAERKSGGSVVITGDNLQIDSEKKIATYTGNVKVVQGETTMFSDTLVIYLDEAGRQLHKAVATGNVRIVDSTVTATGDEGILYNAEQKLELINNAKVWQDNNTITAHRISVYLNEQVLEGHTEDASERASMTIYSTGEFATPFDSRDSEKPQAEASQDQVTAQEPPPKDTTEEDATPIVITSDTLRLDNTAQQATFSGDVEATDHETTLNADDMVVYITQNETAGNDVDRIEVEGNVKITNKTTVVTGATGLFLNQKQFARVEGDEENKAKVDDKEQNLVLEAPVIEIDLKTNQLGATGGAASSSETPAEDTKPSGSQRIRTEFGTEDSDSFFSGDEGTPTPQPETTVAPESEKEIDRSNFPSVTVYPKKEGA